jgi:hypothetical protein
MRPSGTPARCRSATATRSITTPLQQNSPAATCNGNTSEVRQYTVGFYDTIMKDSYGTVKAGVQYSYNQRFAFAGVGGAPKTDDNIVMTQIRYCPF